MEKKLGRKIKEGCLALHHCNDSMCCNSDHIYEGTNQDNMTDKMNRGNCKNGRKMLTTLERNEVKEMYKTGKYVQREIASKFGVTKGTINVIINNRKK